MSTVVSERWDEPDALSILLLCTANVCRSPHAEAVMLYLAEQSRDDVVACSRGLAPPLGARVHPSVVSVCLARRVQIDPERAAVRIVPNDVARADLVLVMEQAHRREVVRQFPAAAGKTYLLGHWINSEITDPIGGNESRFEQCHDEIVRASTTWLAHIRRIRLRHDT